MTSFISAPGSGVSRVNSRRLSNSMEITWLPCGRPIDIGTIYNLESKAARPLGIGAGYKFVTIRFRPRHSPMQMHFVFNEPATESPPSPCSSWYFQRIKTWVPPRVLKSYPMFDLDNSRHVSSQCSKENKFVFEILFVRTYPYFPKYEFSRRNNRLQSIIPSFPKRETFIIPHAKQISPPPLPKE